MKLGTVKRLGYDDKGYERRERLDAIAECPKCGAEIECWADTEEWTRDYDISDPTVPAKGYWIHSQYGGAQGVCEACRILIADCLSDGFRCFNLREDAT
jgi:hypothetical protein